MKLLFIIVESFALSIYLNQYYKVYDYGWLIWVTMCFGIAGTEMVHYMFNQDDYGKGKKSYWGSRWDNVTFAIIIAIPAVVSLPYFLEWRDLMGWFNPAITWVIGLSTWAIYTTVKKKTKTYIEK